MSNRCCTRCSHDNTVGHNLTTGVHPNQVINLEQLPRGRKFVNRFRAPMGSCQPQAIIDNVNISVKLYAVNTMINISHFKRPEIVGSLEAVCLCLFILCLLNRDFARPRRTSSRDHAISSGRRRTQPRIQSYQLTKHL